MSAVKSLEELRARDNGKKDKIVVEKAEAEELLPGWRKEVKTRKVGSWIKKDWYYTDPVTGYTFRSLKDVQRYLKTGEVGKLAIKPKGNSCVDVDNEDIKLHMARQQSTKDGTCGSEKASDPRNKVVEVSDVNLPYAIGLEEREGKSESKEHMMVPGLLSETSRHKRPLENGSEGPRTRSKSSETSKSELPQRASKRLAGIKIDAPSPLPPEPKTRQATRVAGIKIDAPSPSPEPKTRQATRLAGIKIDASPPSLPEPKTRQATRLAGIGVVASVPSPPEPKTSQATRQAGIKVGASVPSPPEPKTRQARRLAGMEIGASPPSLPEPKTRQATRLAGMEIDASPPSLPEPKTRQATRLAGIKIDSPPPSPSPPEPRTCQATARWTREAETRTTVNLAIPKENDKKVEVEKSTSHGMQVECVREITDNHDGNTEMDNKPNHKQEISILLPPVSQESREKVNKDDFKSDEKQELHIALPPAIPSTPKEQYKEIEMGPTGLPPVGRTTPEEQAPPTVVPPVNLGIQMDDKHHEKQELPVVNPPVSNPIPQDSYGGDIKPESSVNFSLNDLWTDPCIEFAVRTLTGAIPFGDLNKADNFPASPLEVPLEELWTDPCIEFAVKTLTGAIPVGEDPCVQDYLQQQPTSSLEPQAVRSFSLPDVGMNFCQTEVLSNHFETAAAAAQNKQQDLVVPTLRNGGLQKSGNGNGNDNGNGNGNGVVPQQVKGSNGQCSRPRFFQ